MIHRKLLAAALLVAAGCASPSDPDADDEEAAAGSESPVSQSRPDPNVEIHLPTQFTLSKGFRRPGSKQGVSEARTSMPASEHQSRYAALRAMGVGYRQYNLYWSELETASTPSSTSASLVCPAGHTRYPQTAAEKTQKGYHRYRCIENAARDRFDELFTRDAASGFQTGVVLYSPPAKYRHSACEGQVIAGTVHKIGCAPRDDKMDDFEDFVSFIASRYDGKSGHGKLGHLILWNEIASPEWFDYTPVVAKNDVSAAGIGKRADKYVSMLKRTHAAMDRHLDDAMLYAPTDMLWEAGLAPGHPGTKRMLDEIWARVGTTLSWSVAVHPYTDPTVAPPPGTYNFQNLDEVVGQYQRDQLAARGVADPWAYPQAYLAATEQGWGVDAGRDIRARNICVAHEEVMDLRSVLFVAHNYFHSIEDENGNAAQSGQGAFFGLIPSTVPSSLVGYKQYPEGKAYRATADSMLWDRRNDNYCCATWGVGCFGGDVRFHPDVFDPWYYRAVNGDLSALSDVELEGHWMANGIGEGREASPWFSVVDYLDIHPDLTAYYGPNRAGAVEHYATHGVKENRPGRAATHPDAFDASHYRDTYADLRYMSVREAQQHWTLFGIAEGRAGTPVFVPKEYLQMYPDVAPPGDYHAAIRHWVKYGKSEGRKGRL